MKFKQIVSSILSGVILFTSLATYSPVNAQQDQYASYLNDLEKVFSWEKLNYKAKGNMTVETKRDNKKETEKYDVNINYDMDRKENKGDIDFEFKIDTFDENDNQKMKLIYDKDNFYIDSVFLNKTFKKQYIDKVFTKDFVKIKFDANNKKYDYGFDTSIIANDFLKNSSKTSENFLKFFRETELKIDLGLQKNDNVYSLNWDENKLLDITNEYVKYVLTHPDYFIKFLEQVLDIKPEDLDMNKEELKNLMAFLYALWVTEIEENLPKYKEIFKGTQISFKETFEENTYKSDYKFIIKIDATKQYLLEDEVKPENPTGEIIDISLNINQTANRLSQLDINMPTNYEEFDFDEFMKNYKETDKNYDDEVNPLEPTKEFEMTETAQDYYIKYTISPSKKTVVSDFNGDIEKYNINCKVEKGVLYIHKKDLAKMLFLDELEEEDEYIPLKKYLEDFGNFTVKWDPKRHEVTAYTKF